jgi:hypothetical protein
MTLERQANAKPYEAILILKAKGSHQWFICKAMLKIRFSFKEDKWQLQGESKQCSHTTCPLQV